MIQAGDGEIDLQSIARLPQALQQVGDAVFDDFVHVNHGKRHLSTRLISQRQSQQLIDQMACPHFTFGDGVELLAQHSRITLP